MRHPGLARGRDRCPALALLAVLALVGGRPAPVAEPAAAFPGKNGRIAFVSNRVTATNPEGDREIFTMNADGTKIKQLTANTAEDTEPTWSPNGKKIAFQSDRDGNNEVYTMDAEGLPQTNRTNQPATDLEPEWQPR